MSQMWVSVISSIGGMFIAGLWGYLKAKSKDKITDRQLLSQDEKSFRDSLLEEIKSYREQIGLLRVDMDSLISTNAELKAENKMLGEKVDELTEELKKFRVKTAT